MKHTGLPSEALLDVALDLLERLAKILAPLSSEAPPQVPLVTTRWRRTTAEERSAALRAVAKARWERVRLERARRQ